MDPVNYPAANMNVTPKFELIEEGSMDSECSSYESESKRRKMSSKLENFNLRELLSNHPVGRALLNAASRNLTLDNHCRAYLCDMIVCDCINKNIILKNEDHDVLSSKIVEIFPNECKNVYYVPPVKKKDSKMDKSEISRGKLPDKYRNTLTLIRTLQRVTCENKFTDQSNPSINSKNWLKVNRDEPLVLTHWDLSYDLRREEIAAKKFKNAADIINDWPILKEPCSFELIRRDFTRKYPAEKDNLYIRWEIFFTQLVNSHVRLLNDQDQGKLSLLSLSEENIGAISKYIIQLEILAVILAPKANKKRIKCKEAGIKFWKPSIEQAKDGIFMHVTSVDEIKNEVAKRAAHAAELNHTLQPFLIVVGEDMMHLTAVYMHLESITFEVTNFLDGLDALFKFYFVFNLPYPIESENIWYFIQWGIYGVRTNSDAQIPLVYSILNKLKILQENGSI